MKAKELIECLQKIVENQGNAQITMEVECNGARSEQGLFDVLSGIQGRILLISKEAMDADPLMGLPIMPNLSLVSGDGEPH